MFSGQIHELLLSIYIGIPGYMEFRWQIEFGMCHENEVFSLLFVPVKLLLKQNKKWFYGV